MGRLAFVVGLVGPALTLLVGLVYLTVRIVSGPRHSHQTRKSEDP